MRTNQILRETNEIPDAVDALITRSARLDGAQVDWSMVGAAVGKASSLLPWGGGRVGGINPDQPRHLRKVTETI